MTREEELEKEINAISARLRRKQLLSKKVELELYARRSALRQEYLTLICKPMQNAFRRKGHPELVEGRPNKS